MSLHAGRSPPFPLQLPDLSMIGFLLRGRYRLARARADAPWMAIWSAPDAALDLALRPKLRRYAAGLVLDVGCGFAPYKSLVSQLKLRHVGSDVLSNPKVDVVADITRLPFASEAFGTVICSEVLEHVWDPKRALAEIARSLQPGGHVILSVPFLARVHEAPNDFFRYTRFALEKLVSDAGLEIVELEECGGLFTFLAHQISSAVVPAAFALNDGIGRAFAAILGLVLTWPAVILDRIPGLSRVYPAGYLTVARKGTAG